MISCQRQPLRQQLHRQLPRHFTKLLSRRFGGTCPRCRSDAAEASEPAQQEHRAYNGPSFDEIFSKRVPTKAFVPKAAKKVWAQCLLAAIAQVLEFNDELAWAEFFMLPKCVLRTSRRGGKRHRKRSEVETKTLCSRWLEGQRDMLWQQGFVPRRNKKQNTEKISPEVRDRVAELVAQGQLHKACSALVNKPPVETTPEVIREMKSKHPVERAPIDWSRLRNIHSSAAPTVEEDCVQRMIMSFAKGSGGGPSGLKPQHIKDALQPGFRDELVRLLTEVVNKVARSNSSKIHTCAQTAIAEPERPSDEN